MAEGRGRGELLSTSQWGSREGEGWGGSRGGEGPAGQLPVTSFLRVGLTAQRPTAAPPLLPHGSPGWGQAFVFGHCRRLRPWTLRMGDLLSTQEVLGVFRTLATAA